VGLVTQICKTSQAGSTTIFQTIQNGRSIIPSFKTAITEEEIRRLAEYVHYLKTNKK